jgi:hypothetical protein
MKRAWTIVGIIGLTTAITYLAVTRHFAQERAKRLDHDLMAAEARLAELEGQMDELQAQLADLRRTQEVLRSAPRSTRPTLTQPASASWPTGAAVARPGLGSGFASSQTTSLGQGEAAPWLRYAALPAGPGISNLVRIEGTSSIHDWQVEGHLLAGRAEFAAGFPGQPEGQVPRGAINARVNVAIPVHSLKSVESNGNHYSDKMDEIMYDKLRDRAYDRITYTLTSLNRNEPSPDGAPFTYEATGNLGVAGVTNRITMPVGISMLPGGIVQFAGSVRLSMKSFRISPPAPSFAGGIIKTGDEVKLSFVWCVKPIGTLEAKK